MLNVQGLKCLSFVSVLSPLCSPPSPPCIKRAAPHPPTPHPPTDAQGPENKPSKDKDGSDKKVRVCGCIWMGGGWGRQRAGGRPVQCVWCVSVRVWSGCDTDVTLLSSPHAVTLLVTASWGVCGCICWEGFQCA